MSDTLTPAPLTAERSYAQQYPLSYVLAYLTLRSGNAILQGTKEHLLAFEAAAAELTARAEKAEARVKSQQDERATATPAWIDMAERLPEDPSYCLVVDESHRVHEMEFNGGHWWTYQADGPMPPVAFSHWMPTPAAPQAAPAALTWPCPGCLATSPKECLASTNACVFRPAQT